MPKISVIMPVYNAEKYLREAIDSILDQTLSDFEFIIIDDGSSDSSPEIIRSYDDPRIRFYQNERNMGVAATLNRGLDLAAGEYIARMDSDDISLPERFEKQADYMDRHPEAAVCGCNIRFIGARWGIQRFAATPEQMKVDMLFSCCLAHPSVILRGTLFGGEGLHYDESYDKMEDYALWVETAKRYRLACVQETLLQYRIHPEQVTQRDSEGLRLQIRRLKKAQLEELDLPTTGDGFETSISSWRKERPEEWEVVALGGYLKQIGRANKRLGIYDQRLLEASLRSVLSRWLDQFPIGKAARLAGKCGRNSGAYAAKRLYRHAATAVMTAVAVKRRQSDLKIKDFTLIANNCWGSFVYQKYGLPYTSPTIGLYILGDDFVKFCADWQGYLKKELEFIPWEASRYYPELAGQQPYPVAKLGDIEIYFMHYHTKEEAREKWDRRKARINPNCMVFKLSQRECCSREDVERFLALPLAHKVCFAYDDVPGAVVIPELRELAGDEWPLVSERFDELKYLNGL